MSERTVICAEQHPFRDWRCSLPPRHIEPYHSAGRGKRWRTTATQPRPNPSAEEASE